MLKIGILTYHNTRNVGAALQAYALQKTITSVGCDCEIIDYRCEHLEEIYKIKKITQLKSIKELIKWFLSVRVSKQSKLKFDAFNKEYQKLSPCTYTNRDIHNTNAIYDMFFVGSDQVWNMNLNGNDTSYLLDFVKSNKRKNSYAASFGYKEIPPEYVHLTRDNLSLFNAIAVRETSGKKIVKTLVEKMCQVVLDPTLLLNIDEWEQLIKTRIYKEDYVLVYIIAATPSILQFAKNLGKKYNCNVICIHNSNTLKKGVINIRDCSPLEFLSYIKYAKFVISSSFHGICFSVLFQKEFYFELDDKFHNNNSRIETLMDNLGLWNRRILDGICVGNDNLDYDIIENKLNLQRQKSMEYIKSTIKNDIGGGK